MNQIGKLIGRYFDSNGTPTEHFHDVLISVNHMKKVNYYHQHFPLISISYRETNKERISIKNGRHAIVNGHRIPDDEYGAQTKGNDVIIYY